MRGHCGFFLPTTVTCPLITDYHRLFALWPGGSVQDFPSFLKDAGQQLERNPARDWGYFFLFFLASQTLSAQTCTKWKQTQSRLLISIRLDLCPSISPAVDTKWPTLLCTVLNIWFIYYIYLAGGAGGGGRGGRGDGGGQVGGGGHWKLLLVSKVRNLDLSGQCGRFFKPYFFFFAVQSYKLHEWHQPGIFWAMWPELTPNPVPLIFTNCLSPANTFHWCGADSVTGS